MLTIKNIDSLKDTYVGHWKIRAIGIEDDYYIIKVVHNGSPFDNFNLMIERQRTKHGDYHIWCSETNREHYIPIECIRDRDEFVRFLIDELI
jgi:phosphopentomutase